MDAVDRFIWVGTIKRICGRKQQSNVGEGIGLPGPTGIDGDGGIVGSLTDRARLANDLKRFRVFIG